MKLNQELVRINRNFLICFMVSASISALAAQLLEETENHFNTTFTIIVGYVVFFTVFGILFYLDNKKRYQSMRKDSIRKELFKLVTSFGVGEVFYLGFRWFSLFYFLEWNLEPFLASLSSESVSTVIYMGIVSIFLKKTQTF